MSDRNKGGSPFVEKANYKEERDGLELRGLDEEDVAIALPYRDGDFRCGCCGRSIQLGLAFNKIDMVEAGCDIEDENFPIVIETSLIVHPKHVCKKHVDEALDCYGIEDNVFSLESREDIFSLAFIIHGYSGGIPINWESCQGAEKEVVAQMVKDSQIKIEGRSVWAASFQSADRYIEATLERWHGVSGLIGMYLDAPVNMLGQTGWDLIEERVKGTDIRDWLNRQPELSGEEVNS